MRGQDRENTVDTAVTLTTALLTSPLSPPHPLCTDEAKRVFVEISEAPASMVADPDSTGCCPSAVPISQVTKALSPLVPLHHPSVKRPRGLDPSPLFTEIL